MASGNRKGWKSTALAGATAVLVCLSALAEAPLKGGDLLWAVRAGSDQADFPYGVAALEDASVAVTGEFWAAAEFGAGSPTATTLTPAGDCDMFLALYNNDGTLRWAASGGGKYSDRGTQVTIGTGGQIIVRGWSFGPVTFGKGSAAETSLYADDESCFEAVYDLEGNLISARLTGDEVFDLPRRSAGMDDGGKVRAGKFTFALPLTGANGGNKVLRSSGMEDAYLAMFGSDMTLQWAVSAGSDENDWGTAVDRLGEDIVLIGAFRQSAVFGHGESNVTILNSAGESDIFVAAFKAEDDPCVAADVNCDGDVNAIDVQLVINGALHLPTNHDTDIDGSGGTDAIDVQIVINGALGLKQDN